MKKILVIDGNIGSHVAVGLARKGLLVRVLVRSVKLNTEWDALGIEQVAGDMSSIDSLAVAFDAVDRFFSVTPYVEKLARLGLNTVEAANRAGVTYIVRSSLMHASEASITLRQWHREVEKAVEDSGIPYTILQPNTFMQSLLVNADTVKASNALFMPQGEGKVSLIDVRDIAAVAVTCLTEPGNAGKKYTITGSEALSNYEIADKLSHLLSRKITYYDVSPEEARDSMVSAGLPAWMIDSLLELFALCRANGCAEVSPTVEQVLNRKPLSFDQFLAESAAAFSPAAGEVAGAA